MYSSDVYKSFFKRICSSIVILAFSVSAVLPSQEALAQALNLPVPGARVAPSAPFTPALIKVLTRYPYQPLKLEFILNTGENA